MSRLRFLSLFEVCEHLTHLGDLLGGGFSAGQRLHHEVGGRTAEGAIQEVTYQLPLGLLLRHPSLIDVGAGGFIPFDEAFGGHNLHEFQHRGVADFAVEHEGGVDVAHGAGTLVPEDAKDFEFGVGGAWKIVTGHLGAGYYEAVRTVNEKSS